MQLTDHPQLFSPTPCPAPTGWKPSPKGEIEKSGSNLTLAWMPLLCHCLYSGKKAEYSTEAGGWTKWPLKVVSCSPPEVHSVL